MPKQTKLDDDALLYQPRKEQTERQKLKDMSFRKKIEYLIEYYKFHAMVTVVVIALVIYILNTVLNPESKTQFYAAVINNPIDEKVIEQYNTDFAKYLKLDPEKEKVDLNTSYNYSSKDMVTENLRQILVTRIQSNQVDVIIAPESEFYSLAYAGAFCKLSDQLPTDIYSSLTDKFYLAHTESDAEQTAYGIYLSDTKLFKDNKKNSERYIMGILTNSHHLDNSIEFVRYLYKDK